MLLCAYAYGVKSDISQVGDFAWHKWCSLQRCCNRSVLSVFINQRCAECVPLYYGLRVCGQKYIIIIIICDRLRKSCSTVE